MSDLDFGSVAVDEILHISKRSLYLVKLEHGSCMLVQLDSTEYMTKDELLNLRYCEVIGLHICIGYEHYYPIQRGIRYKYIQYSLLDVGTYLDNIKDKHMTAKLVSMIYSRVWSSSIELTNAVRDLLVCAINENIEGDEDE